MRAKIITAWTVFVLGTGYCLGGEIRPAKPTDIITSDAVTITVEQQYDAVRPGSKSAAAIHFEMKKGWHLYASEKSAPGQTNLKIRQSANVPIIFDEPIFPAPQWYYDENAGEKLEVFSDKFTVFLPFIAGNAAVKGGESVLAEVKVSIEGALCSGSLCRIPNFRDLITQVVITSDAAMNNARFNLPSPVKGSQATGVEWASYSAGFALLLALAAGLSLNIMPCVWPVLPVIVMRIVEQAKKNRGKSVILGLAFCAGILLFFACLAGANVILQIFCGTALQWGDQFRSAGFVTAMVLLLMALAMFMFGVFTINVPPSIAGKSFSGGSFAGSIGMGFLAAILSTPCSFGILAGAFAWAQGQPLPLATLAIMTIGAGMAVPYAILTSMPTLISRLPPAGRWMEIFKQSIGFVLLIIAVKLIAALPDVRKVSVLYFAVALAFCIWMGSGWVGYNSTALRKWLVRIIAAALAIIAGWFFLKPPAGDIINWQKYEANSIENALAQNRPVLVKFTAEWCLSCLVAEKRVYHRQDIADLIREKDVLAIKADTTMKDYPATYALQNIYKEPGVPVSMLFVPGKKEPARMWRGIDFGNDLKKALEELPPK